MMPHDLLFSHLMDTSADSDGIRQLIHTALPAHASGSLQAALECSDAQYSATMVIL